MTIEKAINGSAAVLKIDGVLDGDLDEVIDALLLAEQAEKLKEL